MALSTALMELKSHILEVTPSNILPNAGIPCRTWMKSRWSLFEHPPPLTPETTLTEPPGTLSQPQRWNPAGRDRKIFLQFTRLLLFPEGRMMLCTSLQRMLWEFKGGTLGRISRGRFCSWSSLSGAWEKGREAPASFGSYTIANACSGYSETACSSWRCPWKA